ncbi:MAG: hypothetical protein H6710_22790 [Myxococcales bacterium]|nr:hypothetical protein [Myxococcales bacterium]
MRGLEARSAALAAALLIACGAKPVEPSPVGGPAPTVVVPPKADTAERPKTPIRHPDREPPPPRAEPQVTDEELARILDEAARLAESGDRNGAMIALRACANKVPASVLCEARLGILLLDVDTRRAECRYFLGEAARAEDAGADAALYRELGDALMQLAMFDEAALAYQRRIDHGATDAADYALLAGALQGINGREAEAADVLRRAFELDPTEVRYLHDEAVLRGQLPGQAGRAALLFREYVGRVPEGESAAKLEIRIAELEEIARQSGEASAPKGTAKKGAQKGPKEGPK